MGFIDHWLHDPKIQRSKPSSSWLTCTILVSHRIFSPYTAVFSCESLDPWWISTGANWMQGAPHAQVAGVCGSSKNGEGLCAKAVGCHCGLLKQSGNLLGSTKVELKPCFLKHSKELSVRYCDIGRTSFFDWLSWVCQNPDWLGQVYQQQWDRDDSKSCCQELESVVEMFDVFCWGEDEQSKF